MAIGRIEIDIDVETAETLKSTTVLHFYHIHHAPRARRPVYYQLYLCILHSMIVPTDLCEY